MAITSISQDELNARLIEKTLPDTPSSPSLYGDRAMTPREIKAAFDALPLLVARRFNDLVESIGAEGEGSLAAALPTGMGEGHTLADLFGEITDGNLAKRLTVAEDVTLDSLYTALLSGKTLLRHSAPTSDTAAEEGTLCLCLADGVAEGLYVQVSKGAPYVWVRYAPEGQYYIPEVTDGVLTFTTTDPTMPTVPAVPLSLLPVLSESDEGKLLTAEGGKWVARENSGNTVVQKTGDSETAVMSQKAATDTFAGTVSPNLFDKSTAIKDSLVNTANGNIATLKDWYVTDFIEVELGKTYSYITPVAGQGTNAAERIPVYDSNKEPNGYIRGTISGDIVTVTVDSAKVGISVYRNDIKYVRFNTDNEQIDVAMFVEGKYPDAYYAYGEKFLDESVRLSPSHIAQMPKVNSILNGKKIAYNGDSICESRTDTASNTYNGGGYAKIISDLTGCSYENRAKSGGVLVSATPDGSYVQRKICTDIENMAADADLICFEGGINDYWKNVPLGDFSESDFTGTLDTTTLSGALESIFRQAIARWVGKPICFVIVHKINNTVYKANTIGYTFAEARERIIAICEKYSIPYLDMYAKGGLNAYNSIHNTTYMTANSTGMADGCHPNEEAYRKYYVPQLIALFEGLLT